MLALEQTYFPPINRKASLIILFAFFVLSSRHCANNKFNSMADLQYFCTINYWSQFHVSACIILSCMYSKQLFLGLRPVSRKPRPGNFSGPQSHFSKSLFKDREVYAPETYEHNFASYFNMWIKQLCIYKVWEFASAFRIGKHFGTSETLFSGSSRNGPYKL